MGNPVVHFEIIGKDANALKRFYGEAFSWEFGPPMHGAGPREYMIANTGVDGSIRGGIGEMDEYRGHVTFYVAVDDIKRALEKVEALGGERITGPDRVPDGPIIALFADPEGHTVGLVQTECVQA